MNEQYNSNSGMAIITRIILTIEFVIGLYVQLKKINRVKQEKAFTWELEIYHSVVCIAYFSFSIFIEILEQFLPDICESTQWILCTFAWLIKTWGVNAIFLHSLSISMSKYIVIVRYKGMSSWRQNTKRLVISAIISFPILWTLLGCVSAGGLPVIHDDFVSSSISMCDGISLNTKELVNVTRSVFCGFIVEENSKNSLNFLYVMSELLCIIQTFITLAINVNILEIFLYFQIFRSMNR